MRFRSFETDTVGDVDVTTHPVELAVSYDNTDFPTNPSYGSSQYFSVTRDFGWLGSDDSWTFIEFEASKYFSLGKSKWAKQRIIALNFWTGDSPTWDENLTPSGLIEVSHRPPFYEGATLGGFYRMRGYPIDRFNDRSVIYTAAEYRYTLKWNPLGNISWLRFLQSDWLQLVGFVEGGRVANEYSFSELFSSWKVDGGMGLRFMFAGAVVHLDVGVSDEGVNAWVMFGHPF
jgi:outer membrane protein assembly factor BamA